MRPRCSAGSSAIAAGLDADVVHEHVDELEGGLLRSALPSLACRLRHLRAVRALMPAASAAGISPMRWVSCTRCARPLGVNEAFLSLFIRGLPKVMVWLENLHFPSPRMNLLGHDAWLDAAGEVGE